VEGKLHLRRTNEIKKEREGVMQRGEMDEMAVLRYTGHPFIDTGIAALTAFAKKRRPEELEEKDLEQVVTYIEQNYVRPPLRGYLTMAFTSNAWFAQDAYNPEKPGLSLEEQTRRRNARDDWAARHLRQWKGPKGDARLSTAALNEETSSSEEQDTSDLCAFTGQTAVTVPLSGKLPPGRVARAQFPLIQGDEAINFFPYGASGIPISGLALLALQFFPMGCARCGNGLLAVHTDNESLLYQLIYKILQQNIRAVAEAQAAHEEKLPRLRRWPKTLLVELLVELEQQRSAREEDLELASLTAYNFNNGKELDLVIYYLPQEIVQFLQIVATPTYRAAWDQLVQRSWQLVYAKREGKNGKGGPPSKEAESSERRYNTLYEDLFDLPSQATRFIRTYFLRLPSRTHLRDDPRSHYSLRREIDLINWPLLALFLERIIRMESTRVEQIRTLGDGLALYVRRQGGRGKRFFRHFFTEQNPSAFRALLIKANIAHMKDKQPSLFDMDTYIEVFEEGYEIMRPDWRLARDLVLMRMIDQLKDWLAQNPDATPEEKENGEHEDDTQPENGQGRTDESISATL
jgi:CRISPR-associated protein Cst1